jgi:uncharacterized protein
MDYGLSPDDVQHIIDALASFPQISKVILFGSRAMGTHKAGSDIDLAIVGNNLRLDDMLEIDARLVQLGMLYKFDLQNYNTISEPDVRAHIDRVGKVLYEVC